MSRLPALRTACSARDASATSATKSTPGPARASTTKTCAPSWRKTRAVAAPIPAPPPVMSAVLPSSLLTEEVYEKEKSIGRRARVLDDLAPARDLLGDPLAELLGRGGNDL